MTWHPIAPNASRWGLGAANPECGHFACPAASPDYACAINAAMPTPVVTARRNLVHRISKLLLRGELNLTPWQLRHAESAIDLLEEERFAEGERTMSETE